MKHKYKIIFGISAGVIMSVLWGFVFYNTLSTPGIFVGIGFGVAFASCGCLIGDIKDQKITKEEKERRYYNKKLISDGLKTELHTPHKVNWPELGLTGIGCFIGLLLNNYIEIERFIKNNFVSFVIESLIVAAAILIINAVVYALKTFLKK